MTRRTPTRRQLDDLVATLRRDLTQLDLTTLETALDIERRCGTTTPDGYPTSVGGGGSGGGEGDPTSGAALAGTQADPHHTHTRGAVHELTEAVAHLGAAVNHIAALARHGTDRPIVPTVCEACKPAGLTHPPDHYGSVGGALTRDMHLCRAVYLYVHRHRTLPSNQQVLKHDQTGTWRIRADASHR